MQFWVITWIYNPWLHEHRGAGCRHFHQGPGSWEAPQILYYAWTPWDVELEGECWDVELYTMSWHSWWASVTVAGTYVTDMVGDRHRIFIQGFYSWHTYLVSIATWRVHTMDRPLSFSCTTYVSRFSFMISHLHWRRRRRRFQPSISL